MRFSNAAMILSWSGSSLPPALGLLVGGLHAEDRLRHLERRIVRRHLVAVRIGGLQPARELGVGRERPERSARAEDGAVGNARAEPVDRGLAGGEDHLVLLEQAARRALQHQPFEIAAPQAGMDHLGAAAEQRGDLGAELAGEQPRHLRGLHLDAGPQRLHRALEVGPGVLAPGVVLVDAGERLHVGKPLHQVERDRHVIHRAGRPGAEHIFVARVLEDARRAAVEQHGELLQLLGDRRDGEAVAARDVADHDVDPRHEVAELGDLLLRTAVLVDDHQLDRPAAEAFLGVGRRHGAGVEHLGGQLGGIARRHAERAGGRPEISVTMPILQRLLRHARAGRTGWRKQPKMRAERSASASHGSSSLDCSEGMLAELVGAGLGICRRMGMRAGHGGFAVRYFAGCSRSPDAARWPAEGGHVRNPG